MRRDESGVETEGSVVSGIRGRAWAERRKVEKVIFRRKRAETER